jgi:hypothetical protein
VVTPELFYTYGELVAGDLLLAASRASWLTKPTERGGLPGDVELDLRRTRLIAQ